MMTTTMDEVNSLYLFALALNDRRHPAIPAHPSSPILKCKHCRVTLKLICKNSECEQIKPTFFGKCLFGQKWPELACTGCKKSLDVLSLIPKCQQGCFSGDAETQIDRYTFELMLKEHDKLFCAIQPVLSSLSAICEEFGYDRVISALDMENIEIICKVVFSLWHSNGAFSDGSFEANIGFFCFAKGLILRMNENEHSLEEDAMDVLSSFLRTNVEQFMTDPNDWNRLVNNFNNTTTIIANKMKDWLTYVKSELDTCIALKPNTDMAFNIAVVGETGSGKSSLINALRGLRPGDEGAAKVGINETTLRRSQYAISNTNMVLNDLPGVGSVDMTKEMYLANVEFACYDFFILVSSGRIKEHDIWFAQQIRKHGKAFFFVKTKIEDNIENEKHDHRKSETETLLKLRKECERELKRIGLFDTDIFLVSSRKTEKADFGELKAELNAGTNIKMISARKRRQALTQKKRQLKLNYQEVCIKVIAILQDLATNLDSETRKMKLLKVGNASVSFACGIASTVCLLASPGTFRASFIPNVIIGTVASTAHHSTQSQETNRKKKLAKAEALLGVVEPQCEDSDESKPESTGSSFSDDVEELQLIKRASPLTGFLYRCIESVAWTPLARTASVARKGLGILGLVCAPLDVYTIVTNSLDLYNGNYSEVAQDIRERKRAIETKLYHSAYKRRCPNSHRCAYKY